jgi:hypothetical protein
MAFSGLIKARERPQTRRRENPKKTVERERRGGAGRRRQRETWRQKNQRNSTITGTKKNIDTKRGGEKDEPGN